MASTAPAITLYRSLLRHGKLLKDYNLRSYAIRRTKTGFRDGRSLGGQDATAALQDAEEQLQVLKRQSLISRLYPSAKSVMEQA